MPAGPNGPMPIGGTLTDAVLQSIPSPPLSWAATRIGPLTGDYFHPCAAPWLVLAIWDGGTASAAA